MEIIKRDCRLEISENKRDRTDDMKLMIVAQAIALGVSGIVMYRNRKEIIRLKKLAYPWSNNPDFRWR